MTKRRKKKKMNELGGCGTNFIVFLVLCVISLLVEYWKIWVPVVSVIMLIVIIAYAVEHDKKVKEKKLIKMRKTSADGIKLTGGYYISGRDIPVGIYDIRAMSGSGFLNLPVNGSLHLSEGETFRNVELLPHSKMCVPVGMSIDLYNQRDFPKVEEKVPKISVHVISSKQGKYDIDNMDGYDFEYFCAKVLKENGYENVEVTRGSGDHGVDIVAMRDGVKYAVQCKRYGNGVGNKAIQEIYSGKAYYHCHVGIVMTNSYFTPSAKEEAERNGIILWDGEFLKTYLDKFIASLNPPSDNFCKESEMPDEESEQAVEENEDSIKMYDTEKGIYPPGHYVVGRTLPKGAYLLKARGGKSGSISFYETLPNLLNDENISSYQTFDDDFFLTLFENDTYVLISDADIQRVYEVN